MAGDSDPQPIDARIRRGFQGPVPQIEIVDVEAAQPDHPVHNQDQAAGLWGLWLFEPIQNKPQLPAVSLDSLLYSALEEHSAYPKSACFQL